MNIFDDFDAILVKFNKIEEVFFLRDIQEFAENHRNTVIQTFSTLLKNKDLNIQLKYLILKSIGNLKFPEFIPILKEALTQETRVQIINEAINSLSSMGSFTTYKVVVDFLSKNSKADFAEKIERNLRDIFIKNPLAFHFDVFYRNRSNVANIEKSSEFIIKHLPNDFLIEILPCVSSRSYKIKFEALRIFKFRPNPTFFTPIFLFFKGHYNYVEGELFLILAEALIENAALSRSKTMIFPKLAEFMEKMDDDRKRIFGTVLLKLNNQALISYVASIYHELNFVQKKLVFKNLNPSEYDAYKDFVKELLRFEDQEDLLADIINIFIRAQEFKFLFDTVDSLQGPRQFNLLNMILEREPKDIDHFIRKYISTSESNDILRLALEYLLRNVPDNYYSLIKPIFFSGISRDIRALIIRNVNKWNAANKRDFMETIFKNLNVIASVKKDFLLTLIALLNEKIFSDTFEDNILNRILVLMEEAPMEEIVNFIYFFDKYSIRDSKDQVLIIDELRMVQNTVLKSSGDQNLVRMIHMLIKNIEKRVKVIKPKEL